jgi:hypothetical protein
MAPNDGKAALLEVKLTVTDRDSPWGTETLGHDALAWASVAVARTMPTVASSIKNAITMG